MFFGQKKKKEVPAQEKRWCQQQACRIQTCIEKNNLQQKHCTAYIDLFNQCCSRHPQTPLCMHVPKDKPQEKKTE